MAIRYRPSGEAVATAKAGEKVGQAEARKEAQRQAERQQQISLQQQAQDAARAWEIQKFVLNSQQDFAHEQRLRQADLDAEARAKEWQVEKMELASQFDFEQEERKRIRDRATAIAGRDAILNSDAPETQQTQALFNLWQKFPWVTELTQYAGGNLRPERQPSIAEQKWGLLTPEEQVKSAKKDIVEKPQTAVQQRKELEAIVGHEIGKFMNIEELQSEAMNKLGISNEPITIPQGQVRPLDDTTAREILIEANGDRERARQIARQRGYSIPQL